MTTHFQGRFEVEFKYRLAALARLDPEVMLEDNRERGCYFDTPGRTLAQEGKSLVIRTMQPSGIRLWILKGPEADAARRSTSATRTRPPAVAGAGRPARAHPGAAGDPLLPHPVRRAGKPTLRKVSTL